MTDYVEGCDISFWDDDGSTPQHIDFVKMKKEGLQFVLIKSSQSLFGDPDIIYNWKSSKDAGLMRGAFHFLTWDTKPEKQAETMATFLGNDIGEIDPTVDFEWWNTQPSNVLDILWAFSVRSEQLFGKKNIIYSAKSFWKQYGSVKKAWSEYPLWLCDINNDPPVLPEPWEDCYIWQYSFNGDGIKYGCESKGLDMNRMKVADFARLTGTTPPIVDPIPTPSTGKKYKNVSGNNMNIRTDININADVIGKIPNGTVFVIDEDLGDWVTIKGMVCKKQNGYTYLKEVL